MIDYATWRHAVAMVESDDNPRAWGDSGLAVGRYQVHPAFMWDWWAVRGVKPAVNAGWDDVSEQAVRNFFNERSKVTDDPVRLAMEFHLGVAAVARGDWDQPYADKFGRWYGDG